MAEVDSDEIGPILDAMAPDSGGRARFSLGCPADSAGGLMIREYLAFGPRAAARVGVGAGHVQHAARHSRPAAAVVAVDQHPALVS